MINRVVLVGRLGKDPESRDTAVAPFCTLSVATSEKWTDKKTKQQMEHTEWHRVVCWGNLAMICVEHCRKGMLIYVEGKIKTRSWQDQAGVTKYTTEIQAAQIQFLSRADGVQQPMAEEEQY